MGHGKASAMYISSLDGKTDFSGFLKEIDVVVHLAGQAHGPSPSYGSHILPSVFWDVNFKGTENLARNAAKSGVKRFVFVSSINVNGKSTGRKRRLTEKDPADPYDEYTLSKFKAEMALRQVEKDTGMEVVIVRPPLVYGPGVKGNFLKLLALVHSRLPLPFSGIDNQRSFIHIENLIEALIICLTHEKARGQTFMVSDDHAVSTPQLLRKISFAMDITPRLFYCPTPIFRRMLTLWGKQGIYERLCLSLIVDSTKIRHSLGWKPKVSIDEGIDKTVQWYLKK